jgi:hypothetical protein
MHEMLDSRVRSRARERASAVDVRRLHSRGVFRNAVHDGGEVNDGASTGERRSDGGRIRQIATSPLGLRGEANRARFVADQKAHWLPTANQRWYQVASDEAGATGDQNHVVAPATGSWAPLLAPGGRNVGLIRRRK